MPLVWTLLRTVGMTTIAAPFIPDTAPFTSEQRQWLNGFLAGAFSGHHANTITPELSAPPKERVPVLFGSQSGNAGELAEEFSGKLIAAGFDAPVIDMEDFEEIDFSKEKTVLIVTSTWGEGDPPDNAVAFWEWLSASDCPRMEHLKYAVCGLGDSNYLNFCATAKKFDERLSELGAAQLTERIDCDVDYEDDAAAWLDSVLEKTGVIAGGSSSSSISPPHTEKTFSKKNPFSAALLCNKKLNSGDSPRDTRHFELLIEGSGMEYEAGDALGVYPKNCPEVAEELIAALGFSGETSDLHETFLSDYSITVPGKKLLDHYRAETGEELDADYLWGREIIDLVSAFPEVKFSPDEFTNLLGKIQPRLYSISSSPKAHPGEVHLTVATVRYESHGRSRKGVCSTFLSDRCNGDGAEVFVHTAKGFRPPADPTTKMIMVGPGTGVAPFRAFLEERREIGAKGQNWLFFGNPHRKSDFLYQEELAGMIENRHLHRLEAAWSRDTDRKIYVQDKMKESADELWRWLDDGAHFYVCGDAKRMAKDVDSVLHDVIATQGGMGEEGAAEYVAEMKKNKRYQRDVY